MQNALDGRSPSSALDLLEAAEHLLEKVIASSCESRDSALDLLTVDALVTQALQEAAKDPATAATFADDAMQRLASHYPS
jgi:hypothetical protein